MLTPRPAPTDLRTLPHLPIAEWRTKVSNDFEAPVFSLHPALAAIKQQLYDGGALYASMSGSGSALYGIFQKGERATITSDVAFDGFYVE
jgi:4-diphosphocytidyl-2-C-methyl-D-erythritol kinase